MRPRLLDLFCGAGGAAVGYHRAGFDVVGVDHKPQPRYPFPFVQADALEYLASLIADGNHDQFDVIHASPPCQAYSVTKNIHNNGHKHSDLIQPTRELLQQIGKPYVIENVPGARRKLQEPVMLCGTMFGLKTYRHRYFETRPFLLMPPHIPHNDSTPKAGRGPSPKGFWSIAGHGGIKGTTEGWAKAMKINWMTRDELAQAIPPAYTDWIGRQLLNALTKPTAGWPSPHHQANRRLALTLSPAQR